MLSHVCQFPILAEFSCEKRNRRQRDYYSVEKQNDICPLLRRELSRAWEPVHVGAIPLWLPCPGGEISAVPRHVGIRGRAGTGACPYKFCSGSQARTWERGAQSPWPAFGMSGGGRIAAFRLLQLSAWGLIPWRGWRSVSQSPEHLAAPRREINPTAESQRMLKQPVLVPNIRFGNQIKILSILSS